jgi:formylglycine-generating enzyme required for sulfatase activity
MRRVDYLVSILVVVVGQAFACSGAADTFGSGANAFEIEFVTIGNPGNPPDTTDRPVTDGAVPYRYRIGKYEISEEMIDKANAESTAGGGPLNITHDGRGANMPVTSISWFEAARFVNWLNTSTGSTPAYKFDASGNFQLWQPADPGYDGTNLFRNKLATYFLPSLSEWHKAAYYDPVAGTYFDYPTGGDTVPDGIDFGGDPVFDAVFFDGGSNVGPNEISNVGLLSPYGTAGQGGNLSEWEETAADRINDDPTDSRGIRGGGWNSGASLLLAYNRNGIGPLFEGAIGFRVASIVPEPNGFTSASIALLLFLIPLFSRRMHPTNR